MTNTVDPARLPYDRLFAAALVAATVAAALIVSHWSGGRQHEWRCAHGISHAHCANPVRR